LARFARLFGGGKPPPRVDRVVVGLGNPGEGYAATRHNVGFQVASRLAKRARAEFALKAADSRIAEGSIDGVRVAIARPQTFMNDSGRAVRKLLDRYRIEPSDLLVVFDEVDLPLGKIRLREKGGPGTHNGMRSIVSAIGEDFPRLRVGVAPADPLRAWCNTCSTRSTLMSARRRRRRSRAPRKRPRSRFAKGFSRR